MVDHKMKNCTFLKTKTEKVRKTSIQDKNTNMIKIKLK